MDITVRMNILKDAGKLSQKNYDRVVTIIDYFKEKYQIELTEENASAFITHVCSALERIDKGETVRPLNESIYKTVCQHPNFQNAWSCCTEMGQLLPGIPSEEMEYICTHVVVLLENIKGGNQ
jgi:hypothetical protein